MPRPPFTLLRPTARLFVVALVAALISIAGGRSATLGQIAPVPLFAGWNNIGYLGPAQPVTAGLAALTGKYDALWQFDGATQAWRSFNPASPASSDFTDLTQGGAYWIHMLSAAILPVGVAGGGSGNVRTLPAGWNNIVQAGGTVDVPAALAPFSVTFSAVWHWNAATQRWELYDPANPGVSDFRSLVQGQAYFVQVVSGTPLPTGPAAQTCFAFESYQPQLSEVTDTLNRAGANALTSEPPFRLPDAHISLSGGPETMPGYIPPTVLKSIAWYESKWQQATWSVSRGNRGRTITSSECAYGVLQVLTGMEHISTPDPRQNLIGTDFLHNAAAGAQVLLDKWNHAPQMLPIYGRRDPRVIEDWYYALWAYHCFGDICAKYDVHNNPDDPALKWPRPMYGSQAYTDGPFTHADYPYQEVIFGQIAYPPAQSGVALWQAIPVLLPPHGTIGFPVPNGSIEASAHLESGQALVVPTPVPTATPSPTPSPTPGPAAATPATTPLPAGTPTPNPTPRPAGSTYFPPVDGG